MATFCFADTEDIEIQVALVLLAYRVSAAFGAPNNVVCEANVRHTSKSLLYGEDSMSSGVVPSRHIALASSIRGLRPRLSSLRSVVPSRHIMFAPIVHCAWEAGHVLWRSAPLLRLMPIEFMLQVLLKAQESKNTLIPRSSLRRAFTARLQSLRRPCAKI